MKDPTKRPSNYLEISFIDKFQFIVAEEMVADLKKRDSLIWQFMEYIHLDMEFELIYIFMGGFKGIEN